METKKESLITRLTAKARDIINYCWTGVWKETRDTNGIRALKVANLSVRCFFDRDLQAKSCFTAAGPIPGILFKLFLTPVFRP